MLAVSREEAWRKVDKLFPTDYIEDARASSNAGYPIYRSTADGHFYDYICDLCTVLEVNLGPKTIRISIVPYADMTPVQRCEYLGMWDYNGQYQ